jgi:hypothetical protein
MSFAAVSDSPKLPVPATPLTTSPGRLVNHLGQRGNWSNRLSSSLPPSRGSGDGFLRLGHSLGIRRCSYRLDRRRRRHGDLLQSRFRGPGEISEVVRPGAQTQRVPVWQWGTVVGYWVSAGRKREVLGFHSLTCILLCRLCHLVLWIMSCKAIHVLRTQPKKSQAMELENGSEYGH